jgi:choline dehydrogenase
MSHSLLVLEKRPWVFLIELFKYLLFGTGMLLAPVLQLAIFTSSKFLDGRGEPSKTDKARRDELPDLEIMPVSTVPPIHICRP